MPAPSPLFRPSLLTLCFVTLLAAAVAMPASAATLRVSPPADPAEIGGYLVLALELTDTDSGALDPARVEAVVTAGAGGLLAEPYPLKTLSATAGATTLEWAAPISLQAAPGTYPLRVVVRERGTGGAELATWEGEITLDFGPGWRAEKITHLIQTRGLPLFLLVVFGFGVLMSFTPCVYPMIPITLAVIGAQSQDKGLGKGFLLSLTYGLGLALIYAAIGAVAATVFSGITAYLQSPPVLIPIALLLVVLAFGMFGAYELQAPAFLRDRLQGPGGNRAGVVGAFVMGMVAGLVASPCVGPFLSALLLWVGTTGSLFLGFWTLFVFGLGVSTLLVLVGTFPAALGSLPQSGGWMESVKKSMGLLLVFMAFYFVRPSVVLPEQFFYPLLGAVTIVVAIYLGAFDAVTAETHWRVRARKALGLIVLVVGLYLFGGSLLRFGLLLPGGPLPAGSASASAVTALHGGTTEASRGLSVVPPAGTPSDDSPAALPPKVPWQVVHTGENVRAFIDARIAEAQSSGRPVIIDFWATWCKFCILLDKRVWNQPEVVRESLRYVTLKVDATASDAEMQAIWDEYRISGLPAIIFIDSRGEVLHGKTLSGFTPAEQMLAHMQEIR